MPFADSQNKAKIYSVFLYPVFQLTELSQYIYNCFLLDISNTL